MATLSDRNYDIPILLQNEIFILPSCKQQNSSHLVFKWKAFHYNRNKIPSQYFFSVFYLKLPLEELTKENNNEKFHGLLLFLRHVLGSKSICKSH